ncbi:MAG TPA: UvrD-helicase domain-containing protein [Steroidobacteraceae bacterium]|jgi:ATP-dependent exoDNAse (exonuclease V) beta subunit|nr:UvrD-helicase domain-containing protein [Steroidobacteraceae bacterium]
MSGELEADAQARLRAVDPARSVILQAPAGSGKTTVLIERLLVLLAQAHTPEEILAITFTRKAAAEMALRIAQVLKRRSAAAADPRAQHLEHLAQAVRLRSQARGWRLEENPNRLRIQTVDALNRALALQMPLAAGGSGALEVLAQPQTAYQIAARRALLDAQAEAGLRPAVQLLFERMENDFSRCETLIAQMLARRAHWLPYLVGNAAVQLAARVRASLAAVVQAQLARGRQLFTATLLQEGLSIGAATARHLQAQGAAAGPWCELRDATAAAAAPSLSQWQALAMLALTQKGEWRKRLTVQQGFAPADAPLKRRASEWLAQLAERRGALEFLDEIRELPDPRLSEDETQVLGALARLLELAVAELTLVFGELGRVDYPAIAQAASAALGSVDDPTELALRLDNHIRHILVDEFQDTSLEQTRLLVQLTAGWQAGDGRTLFLVGDPMQSIYGFREAEVGSFLSARDLGIGGIALEPLTLYGNFRSAPEVVQWNNSVFARCFPQADDPRTSAVAYVPSIAARAGQHCGAVQLHRVLPGDWAGEAEGIVRVVADLRAAQPAASIAVLVSTRAHAGPIVAALTAAQIEVAGVDLVSLQQLSIVRDLTALTLAVDHLGDRTAWLAILRAPWCGLDLRQISLLAGSDRRATLWARLCDPQALAALDAQAHSKVRRLHAVLAVSFEESQHTYANGRESLARRIESAWLRLGGPAACAHEQDLVHARAFFAALAQWSQEPDWSGPQQLPQRLKRLYATHPSRSDQAVQIMTIHHAKGLEFDHVILPGLGRQRRGNVRTLLQWLDLPRAGGGSDLLMVAVPPAAAAGPTALGHYVTRLQNLRERNEATRLLYVAATRARLQLHLFGQLEDPTEEKPAPAPRAGTLLHRLWPALGDAFPQRAQLLSDAGLSAPSAPLSVPTLERLAGDWTLPQLPPGPQPPMLPIASYEPVRSAAGSPVEQVVCEVLRSLARRRRVPARDGGELAQQVQRRLQRLGCLPAEMSERTAQAVELLQSCLDDPRLQWIFSSLTAAGSAAEVPLPLTGMFAGRLTSVRADLSFKDAAGTRWLIDIAPLPQQTDAASAPDAALTAAFEVRLAQQLQLASALGDAPARAAVYLPARQLFWSGPAA